MLTSLSKVRRNETASTAHITAPVGGWNARDSIAAMKPEDAILMDNAYPTPTDVMLRKGQANHVTGISGQVQSLMVYSTPAGTMQLYGAAGTSFYNVTSAGPVGAAVVTSLSNAKWESVNFTDSSGNSWLVTVNGVDKPRYWDGATWTAIDSGSTPAILGPTTTTLSNVTTHKNRLWFTQTNTLKAFYLAPDAVGGTAGTLDLSGVARYGGFLRAIDTWTLDAGSGMDDFWVGVTSEGEAIVYKGTDPTSSNTWALVGVYVIGEPIGKRCTLKYGGELLIITNEGVVSLSKALISGKVKTASNVTDKIQKAMTDAAVLYGSNFGWELEHYPKAQMLVMNVPINDGSNQHQYVMNSITGAWGRFKDVEANCWAIFNGEPYFGGNGVVSKFWNNLSDNSTNIQADIKTAFNYFGRPGVKKHWTRARPIFSTDGQPAVSLGLNVDYSDDAPSGTLTFNPTSYAVWDSSLWDVGIWGGGLNVSRAWTFVGGLGFCAATRMRIAAQNIEVRWQAIDFIYKLGGAL